MEHKRKQERKKEERELKERKERIRKAKEEHERARKEEEERKQAFSGKMRYFVSRNQIPNSFGTDLIKSRLHSSHLFLRLY